MASAGGDVGRTGDRSIVNMMEEHLLLPLHITILADSFLSLETLDLNNK